MKKALFIFGLTMVLMACGNSSNSNKGSDTATGMSPGAIDAETEHPTGVTNQNVISTDTAAMNVERMSDTTGNR